MVVALISALAAPARMVAQGSPTGTLTGTVTDPSGAVLPGVTVAAKSAQTGLTQQTISGADGDWRIPALPVGTYELTFELDGFKRLVRERHHRRSRRHAFGSGHARGRRSVRNRPRDRRRGLLSTTTSTTSRSLTAAELEAIPTSTGSFTHLLSSEAGVSADLPPVLDERHRQHLAVGQRHAHDEHQPVLQRHRCDEPDHATKDR